MPNGSSRAEVAYQKGDTDMVKYRYGIRGRRMALLATAALVFAACGGSDSDGAAGDSEGESSAPASETDSEAPSDDALRVVLVLNGNLGDKSFNDSAQRGMDLSMDQLGVDARTVEIGPDPAAWGPGLADVAADEDSYDVLITSTFSMAEHIQEVAPAHPDKDFIILDVAVDYEACECGNVHSIVYRQNEASYLGGLYAGLMTQEAGLDGINDAATVGFIGGIDIPVINDFKVGYEQGAKAAGDVEVLVQYAGSFDDPARGKEIALALYSQDADILFHASGGTGQGLFEAAEEQGAWSIGVDQDQGLSLEDGSPGQAATVLTSVLKNLDTSIVRALERHAEGTLAYGEAEALGVADGGVGLVRSERFAEVTPAAVVEAIDQAEADIANGTIVVDTAFE